MQIVDEQDEQEVLLVLGAEVAQLLSSEKYEILAERFGYALAFGRNPADAIREDLSACLATLEAEGLFSIGKVEPKISYFQANESNLIAVVELIINASNGRMLLVELIVTGTNSGRFITLEQISAVS